MYVFALWSCTVHEWTSILNNGDIKGKFFRIDDPEFHALLKEQVANPDAQIGLVENYCKNNTIKVIDELDPPIELTQDGHL